MPYAQNVGDHAAPGGVDDIEQVVREAWRQVRAQAHGRDDGVVVTGQYMATIDQTRVEARDG
jgi:hypothetical protein